MNIFGLRLISVRRKIVVCISRSSVIRKGLSASDAGALPIIGYRVNGVMNAKVAVSAPRCAAVRSWRAPSCRFLVWYKTMFLMSCTKKGFSTNELQKQLGLKHSTGMGDGTQTPQGDGQPGCKVYTGRDDKNWMRVTFRWPVRKSSEARVHVAGEPRESRTLR